QPARPSRLLQDGWSNSVSPKQPKTPFWAPSNHRQFCSSGGGGFSSFASFVVSDTRSVVFGDGGCPRPQSRRANQCVVTRCWVSLKLSPALDKSRRCAK